MPCTMGSSGPGTTRLTPLAWAKATRSESGTFVVRSVAAVPGFPGQT